MGGSAKKDRQFHVARFVQGDVATSNASGKPNGRHARIGLGFGNMALFFGRLECIMRTNLRMISNHILSAVAVSSIAG